MDTLHWLVAFLAAHYIAIAGGALIVAATIRNQLYPEGHEPTWFSITVDLLSLAAQKGKVGVVGQLSAPLFLSRHPSPATLPATHPPAPNIVNIATPVEVAK